MIEPEENAKPPEYLRDIGASIFPWHLFKNCESALMLFCAGFYGRNDCIWAARAGLPRVTAVDYDAERMEIMRRLYPAHWRFIEADVFPWSAQHTDTYEVVVVDCQSSHDERCLSLYDRWCGLATKAVVQTVMRETIERMHLVPGLDIGDWQITRLMERSYGGAYWLVLEPNE